MSLRDEISELDPIDAPGLTIAERIYRLRLMHADKPGKALSHDKFAELIGGRATRLTVIRWEKGTVPVAYAGRLGELAGVSAQLFLRETAPSERQILLAINDKLDCILARLGQPVGGTEAAGVPEAATRIAGAAAEDSVRRGGRVRRAQAGRRTP